MNLPFGMYYFLSVNQIIFCTSWKVHKRTYFLKNLISRRKLSTSYVNQTTPQFLFTFQKNIFSRIISFIYIYSFKKLKTIKNILVNQYYIWKSMVKKKKNIYYLKERVVFFTTIVILCIILLITRYINNMKILYLYINK